jgi:co-chaperonin GroES (HSP10)
MSAALQLMSNLTPADAKHALLETLGDISGIELTLNRILIAIWVRPEKTTGGIILTDKFRDEDKWQGVSGLVVAMGPQAFAENGEIEFTPGDIAKVGDWVMFRKGDGVRVSVNKHECILLTSERGILAKVDRPDRVF